MHAFAKLCGLFFDFLCWIYKKLGINGILAILILIEIPILYLFYADNHSYYAIKDNYKLVDVTKYKELSAEEVPESASTDSHYYYAIIRIDNYYYQETHLPDLEAIDQNGDFLSVSTCDYYDDLEEQTQYPTHPRAAIPAGTAVNAAYLLKIPDYDLKDITSITFYSFLDHIDAASEQAEYENGKRITVPFQP